MEIDVLKKEQAFQESEIRASARQSRFFIILSISLAVIFALLAVGFFETRKFNKQLNLRNKEIIRQNNFIESKQKELIRQHQTLQKLSKEKDDLINIVAHDLRSPLNQLKGLITIIKMELLSFFSSETNMYFEKIDVSINTLRDRINRILDVEQINSENVQMVIESLDPNEILSDLQSDFVGEATKKGIKIQFIRNGVSDHIKADLTYTIQVLENLVSNAIKFSKAGEDITLRVSKAGERIRLHVKDNGPGLTKEDQQNLFKKFTRLSAKPTGNEKSIGLGLAIVKKYMENMNGKVWCESEEGKGSEFIAEFDTASLS
jgi:signal transduction histidine kinase